MDTAVKGLSAFVEITLRDDADEGNQSCRLTGKRPVSMDEVLML
jgi:hypothetical protein